MSDSQVLPLSEALPVKRPGLSLLIEPWVPWIVWLATLAAGALLFLWEDPRAAGWAAGIFVGFASVGTLARLPAIRWRNRRAAEVWDFLGPLQGGHERWTLQAERAGWPLQADVGMYGVSLKVTAHCPVEAILGHGPIPRGGDERYEQPGNIFADGDEGLGRVLGKPGVDEALGTLFQEIPDGKVRLVLGRSSVVLWLGGFSLETARREQAERLVAALMAVVRAAARKG